VRGYTLRCREEIETNYKFGNAQSLKEVMLQVLKGQGDKKKLFTP
jgi:hypothetical protein